MPIKKLKWKKISVDWIQKRKKRDLGKIVRNSQLENCLDGEINQLNNIYIINSNQPNLIENNSDGVQLKLVNGEQIETEIFILSLTKSHIT